MTRVGFALCLTVLSLQARAIAASFDLERDGWYTWRLEAAEDTPAWCCVDAGNAIPAHRPCGLDSRQTSYVGCGRASPADGFMQVYAKIHAGEVVELRALSPACPVESESRIVDLGAVDVEESFRWLRRRMFSDDGPHVRQQAAFVLSQSTSADRTRALIRQGRQDADGDTRAKAWVWLAQTGASETEAAIIEAIGTDPDAGVREEAVFALSQLPGERAVDALLAVLASHRLNRVVRERALFWLAESGSDRGLAVIERLITRGETRLY